MTKKTGPIGVFDSGIGGLTVLKALQEKYPRESYVYIGDTARLPYGTKSPDTIIRYCEGITKIILNHDVRAIVVACNTASTHALHTVEKLAGPVPVLGMITPTAKQAIAKTKNRHIALMATYGTVHSGVYERTIQALDPSMRVSSVACQMLVALAEEGWLDNNVAEMTLRHYLGPLFEGADKPDTIILGCTHFPVFENLIRKIVGADVALINSGRAAAEHLVLEDTPANDSVTKYFATDDPARFASSAQKFFGKDIAAADVALIDL